MITRIIPRLDVKGPNLVKGVHLEGLRVLGQPEVFARHYYEHGADELLFMDVVASLYGRNSILDIIRRTAREIFIPLAVGGGLRTLEDIRAVLRAGADKVTLNTAAVGRPELITEASRRFGASTIVVSVEAKFRADGSWEAYTDNGREQTGLNAVKWAGKAAELGAGELIVTSIDREGTGKGYDLELIRRVAAAVSIPIIACGGAGTPAHVAEALEAGAGAASLASMLHYQVLQEHPGEAGPRTKFALGGRPTFGKVQETSLPDLNAYLLARGISCRPRLTSPLDV